MIVERVQTAIEESPEGDDLPSILRSVRPALPIRNGRIDLSSAQLVDSEAQVLSVAQSTLEPCLSSVGCIQAANLPVNLPSLGTGWLIGEDTIVTNRHVAELICERDSDDYHFRMGLFGRPLIPKFENRHELGTIEGSSYPITRPLWLEPDPNKADIAFLQIDPSAHGDTLRPIALAFTDAKPGHRVVALGHPIDRDLDVKQISPGLVLFDEKGWPTHDCNSIGGNSGAAILDPNSGAAVGLQFASPEPFKSFFVQASIIKEYLSRRPWVASRKISLAPPSAPPIAAEQIGVTVPVHLRISVQLDRGHDAEARAVPPPAPPAPFPIESDHGGTLGDEWEHGGEEDDGRRVGIMYATTRRLDESGIAFFTGERTRPEVITYGTAKVRIPERHRIGRVELPFKLRLFSIAILEQSLDSQKHFIIEAVDVTSLQE
jgi:endonuclease G